MLVNVCGDMLIKHLYNHNSLHSDHYLLCALSGAHSSFHRICGLISPAADGGLAIVSWIMGVS